MRLTEPCRVSTQTAADVILVCACLMIQMMSIDWVAQLQNEFTHAHGGHVGFRFNGVASQTERSLPKQ